MTKEYMRNISGIKPEYAEQNRNAGGIEIKKAAILAAFQIWICGIGLINFFSICC